MKEQTPAKTVSLSLSLFLSLPLSLRAQENDDCLLGGKLAAVNIVTARTLVRKTAKEMVEERKFTF